MSEQPHFVVDSQGQAEKIPVNRSISDRQQRLLIKAGGAFIGFTPYEGDEIQKMDYFVDPTGRVIDTRSGKQAPEAEGDSGGVNPAVIEQREAELRAQHGDKQ